MGTKTRIITLQAAATIDAAEAQLGSMLPIVDYDLMTIYLDYIKGDETGVYIYPKFMDQLGNVDAQWEDWTVAAGDKIHTRNRLYLTASGDHYYDFNIKGKMLCQFYDDANGGTPTGTLAATVVLECIG